MDFTIPSSFAELKLPFDSSADLAGQAEKRVIDEADGVRDRVLEEGADFFSAENAGVAVGLVRSLGALPDGAKGAAMDALVAVLRSAVAVWKNPRP